MGSYMRLDGKEINSKHTSELIYDEILNLRRNILENGTDLEYSYLTQEVDIAGVPTGNWKINRKALAFILGTFLNTVNDLEQCKEYVKSSEEYQYYKECSDVDREEALERHVERHQIALQLCIDCLTHVLCDMVIKGKKRIKLTWS